jgi:hypothetical protein
MILAALPFWQAMVEGEPGTWPQAGPGPGSGWHCNLPGYPIIEIAIYPGIVRLAARNLQARNTSRREAS